MEYSISRSEDEQYVERVVIGGVDRISAMARNIEDHVVDKAHGVSRFFVDMTRTRNLESVAGAIDSPTMTYSAKR